MKRWICGVLAVMLMIGLCGCGEDVRPMGTVDPVADQEQISAEVQTVVDMMSSVPVGTMGVSLKAIESAVTLLDWCQATTMTNEQIEKELSAYYKDLGDEAQFLFAEQTRLVTQAAEALRDEARRKTDLAQVNVDPEDHPWDDKAFDTAALIGSVTAG